MPIITSKLSVKQKIVKKQVLARGNSFLLLINKELTMEVFSFAQLDFLVGT